MIQSPATRRGSPFSENYKSRITTNAKRYREGFFLRSPAKAVRHRRGFVRRCAVIAGFVCCGFTVCLVMWACSPGPETQSKTELVIASWNVEALFDGQDDGSEYSDYTQAAGWTEEKYRARLNGIAGALQNIAGKAEDTASGHNTGKPGTDILALIELENTKVLQDIAELPGMEYRWFFFAGTPGSPIGLGVLSRFPLIESRAHSIHAYGVDVPRPVVEVRVDTGTGDLVLLICHWKSKLGGEEKTEAARRVEAGIIARRLEELTAAEPKTPVIVLGDLNENYDEFERTGAAYPCALLPDTAEAALITEIPGIPALPAASGLKRAGIRPRLQDFLVLSGERPPRTDHFGTVAALFSPWINNSTHHGSYYYQESWETIDHVLLNAALFNGEGWEYGAFRITAGPPFTTAAGIPAKYNPRTGNGLSDHLPLVLTLTRE